MSKTETALIEMSKCRVQSKDILASLKQKDRKNVSIYEDNIQYMSEIKSYRASWETADITFVI